MAPAKLLPAAKVLEALAAKQTGKTGKGNGEILAIMCAILLTIK